MDSLPETLITLLLVIWTGPVYDILSLSVLFLAAFFWVIRIKREIQQQYFNSLWRAFKSLFKIRNSYGESRKKKNEKKESH